MFKKLQRTRTSLLWHREVKETHHVVLEATMPLELLFKIVDDYGPELTQDNGRSLRALAYTCRALAAYCRPLLFHSVTLYALNPPVLQASWLGPTTRSEQFSCLVRVYPLSASLIKELRIVVIKPFPTKQEKVLKKIGIDTQRSEMKPWRSLLKGSYPSLTKLRAIISWRHVSPLLVDAFLKAIKRMPALETLELEGDGLPIQRVLQSLPATLKHLLFLVGRFFISPPSQWNLTPDPVPILDSLTLSTYLPLTWLSLVLFSQSPPFHLESLTHLQTRPYRMTPEILRLHGTPSNTLQCLHMYLDYIHFDEDPLNIAELRALTHVEVIVGGLWNDFRDLHAVAWLESSMQTLGAISLPGVVARLSTLTVCLLIHLEVKTQQEWDDTLRMQLEEWEFALRTSESRYIELTNVVAFATAIRRPNGSFPGYFAEVGTPQPLPTRDEAPVSSYESLWKSCGCTGWRHW
ncbi:hypothetical protein BKA70DRAFT_1437971 [Coprinopsis sp. MPI-PUGE-AT-0042]|nr:hypothetical protein BKA70DRAFT_1437971 [Coprinopsis sp. MPI-PUGE-AT-0042]